MTIRRGKPRSTLSRRVCLSTTALKSPSTRPRSRPETAVALAPPPETGETGGVAALGDIARADLFGELDLDIDTETLLGEAIALDQEPEVPEAPEMDAFTDDLAMRLGLMDSTPQQIADTASQLHDDTSRQVSSAAKAAKRAARAASQAAKATSEVVKVATDVLRSRVEEDNDRASGGVAGTTILGGAVVLPGGAWPGGTVVGGEANEGGVVVGGGVVGGNLAGGNHPGGTVVIGGGYPMGIAPTSGVSAAGGATDTVGPGEGNGAGMSVAQVPYGLSAFRRRRWLVLSHRRRVCRWSACPARFAHACLTRTWFTVFGVPVADAALTGATETGATVSGLPLSNTQPGSAFGVAVPPSMVAIPAVAPAEVAANNSLRGLEDALGKLTDLVSQRLPADTPTDAATPDDDAPGGALLSLSDIDSLVQPKVEPKPAPVTLTAQDAENPTQVRSLLAEMFGIKDLKAEPVGPDNAVPANDPRNEATATEESPFDFGEPAATAEPETVTRSAPEPEPAREPEPEPEPAAEDSISEYMERLLARNKKGGSGAAPSPAKSAAESRLLPAKSTKVEDLDLSGLTSETKSDDDTDNEPAPPPVPRERVNPEELRVRHEFLRELANQSARQALALYRERQERLNRYFKGATCTAALGLSGFVLGGFSGAGGLQSIHGWIALGIAGFMGTSLGFDIQQLRKMKSRAPRGKILGPEGTGHHQRPRRFAHHRGVRRVSDFPGMPAGAGPKGSPGVLVTREFPGFRPKRLQPRPPAATGDSPPSGSSKRLSTVAPPLSRDPAHRHSGSGDASAIRPFVPHQRGVAVRQHNPLNRQSVHRIHPEEFDSFRKPPPQGVRLRRGRDSLPPPFARSSLQRLSPPHAAGLRVDRAEVVSTEHHDHVLHASHTFLHPFDDARSKVDHPPIAACPAVDPRERQTVLDQVRIVGFSPA